MGMNPKTGVFEPLTALEADRRRNQGWPVFESGEEIEIKGWRFEVVLCEGRALILRGAGPVGGTYEGVTEALDEIGGFGRHDDHSAALQREVQRHIKSLRDGE